MLLASVTELPLVLKSGVVINICSYWEEALYSGVMFMEIETLKVFMEEISEGFQLKELTDRWLHSVKKRKSRFANRCITGNM